MTKFPVRDSSQSLKTALHGIEVDTRYKPLFDCIVSTIQPYNGDIIRLSGRFTISIFLTSISCFSNLLHRLTFGESS